MATLVPNPDGCTQFTPNPFKKEKCKNCGHLWTSHEGVITEDQKAGYLAAIKKVADEKQAKEEEAKNKAKAEALRKKKQNQAVEDEWFFDGKEQQGMEADSDEEEDGHLRMWNADDLSQASKPKEAVNKPLKVVNLIDFGECDIAEETPPEPPAGAGMAAQGGGPPAGPGSMGMGSIPSVASDSALSLGGGVNEPMLGGHSMMGAPSPFIGTPPPADQDLLNEIQDLRQMLADANEEKNIQVAIVRDEVAEKQQLVEDLLRQRAEAEVSLKDLRAQLEAFQQQAAREKEMEREREEATTRAELERVDAARHKQEAEQLRAEVEQLKAAAGSAADAASQPPAVDTSGMEEAVKQANVRVEAERAEAERLRAEAEQLRVEAARLQSEVERMEAAATAAAATGAPALSAATEALAAAEQARADAERHKADGEKLRAEAERQTEQAENLRAEVARLQAAAEQAAAVAATPAPVAEVPSAAAGLIAECSNLCVQTRAALGREGGDIPEQATAPRPGGDLEAQLRALRDLTARSLVAAECASSNHRQLITKVHDAEKATSGAANLTPISAAADKSAQETQLPAGVPALPNSVPASPAVSVGLPKRAGEVPHVLRTPGSQGHPAGAVELAQALKEIRLSAEQQLEWIVHRMRTSSPKGELPKLGERISSPKLEAA